MHVDAVPPSQMLDGDRGILARPKETFQQEGQSAKLIPRGDERQTLKYAR
jgi:hypothetical protein